LSALGNNVNQTAGAKYIKDKISKITGIIIEILLIKVFCKKVDKTLLYHRVTL
jgi:hypothetical protein